jgi:hypothetical protein
MDFDPFSTHFQRKEKKREEFKLVLQELVEGTASLVEGQRCFADEFGLSYGRVFSDDFESFKGKDNCKVISDWIRGGEEGARRLKQLFDDLAQHQMALVAAFDKVASESAEMGKSKKGRRTGKYSNDMQADASGKGSRQQYSNTQQHLILTAFVAGYAKAREEMRFDAEGSDKEIVTGMLEMTTNKVGRHA